MNYVTIQKEKISTHTVSQINRPASYPCCDAPLYHDGEPLHQK